MVPAVSSKRASVDLPGARIARRPPAEYDAAHIADTRSEPDSAFMLPLSRRMAVAGHHIIHECIRQQHGPVRIIMQDGKPGPDAGVTQ